MFMLISAVILILIEDANTNIDDADTDTNIVKTFFLHLTDYIISFFLGRHGFPFQGRYKISTYILRAPMRYRIFLDAVRLR